jgi:deoxyribodipyrimidine photo-lyase
MQPKHDISLFIFTRDLRLYDNTSLNLALKNSNKVIPIFILNPSQLSDKLNSYKSDNCVQFMIECLDDLNDSLEEKGSRLFYFYSTDYESTVRKIINKSDKYEIKSIYITKDYTPFAKKREHVLQKICKDEELNLFIVEDHMLTGYDKVKKDNGSYYVKFTPYYRAALKVDIEKPKSKVKKEKTDKQKEQFEKMRKAREAKIEENKKIKAQTDKKEKALPMTTRCTSDAGGGETALEKELNESKKMATVPATV